MRRGAVTGGAAVTKAAVLPDNRRSLGKNTTTMPRSSGSLPFVPIYFSYFSDPSATAAARQFQLTVIGLQLGCRHTAVLGSRGHAGLALFSLAKDLSKIYRL